MTSNQSYCLSVELKSDMRHLTKIKGDCRLWARPHVLVLLTYMSGN